MRMAKKIIVHKLGFSGKLLEVSTRNYLSLFGPTSIIPVYDNKSKTLYTWIGNKVPQSLRNFIPKIRKIFAETYPNSTVLRYVTIDAYSESDDFLKLFDMQEGEIEKHLKDIENKRISIIEDIERMSVMENNKLMVNKFDEAIKIANEIIQLADEINDKETQDEQRAFIERVKVKRDKNEKINLAKQRSDDLRQRLDNINAPEDIIEVHKIISEFKNEWGDIIRKAKIESATKLIIKEKEIWKEFFNRQEQNMEFVLDKVKKINEAISKGEMAKIEGDIDLVLKKINDLVDQDIKAGWVDQKEQLMNTINNLDLKTEAISALEEANSLINKKAFDNAINILNQTLNRIESTNLTDEIESIREKISLIEKEEEKFSFNQQKLANLQASYKKARDNDNLDAALISSRSIFEIAQQLENQKLIEKYSNFSDELQKEIDHKKELKAKEIQELQEKAKELEDVIKVEENVLPIMEEFSVDEILGDLSEDIDTALDQIGGVLEGHRVEVKEEINNKAVLKTRSGEVMELEKDVKVENQKDGKGSVVSSGLTNPFDEILEEAVLTDLIPYNYEIDNVELEGKRIDQLPDQSMTKEGLEVNWILKDVEPRKKVDLNYNLRRRVSRTILFILQDHLKIIKTHSNLDKLELDGFFEVNMPFSNNFGDIIEGVVLEDIIPLYYVHSIKEPEDLLPDESKKAESGELLKWNLKTLLPDKTRNYTYTLLELYKFEELKININELNKQAEEYLSKGELKAALETYKNIVNQLSEYIG